VSNDLEALQKQLDHAHNNLRLIQERKSEYATTQDIPPDLIQNEQRWQAEVDRLQGRINDIKRSTSLASRLKGDLKTTLLIALGGILVFGLVVVLALATGALSEIFDQGSTPTTLSYHDQTVLSRHV
jgi:hypothetical protein